MLRIPWPKQPQRLLGLDATSLYWRQSWAEAMNEGILGLVEPASECLD